MNNQDSIYTFKQAPAPAKKPAATHEWLSELDPHAAIRRALAADPNVEKALKEIDGGSLKSLVRKAIEQ
jgi:hypothetical protein